MADDVTPGWRFVHIGLEGDDFPGIGHYVWHRKWHGGARRISVAHPNYPAQRHTFSVYRLNTDDGQVEFAGGEYSNNVWGFFVPDGAA
jgi:hypothetical protein